MHLKELTLYGFKSFGDRVKIEFNPHLTAIVGPNGSGKSNIVDSVRWLLGDQSYKSLRVPSSEEVIFKGSDQDAAFNFSHVGMVMDLGEEGEMQVERKFHRSGENEYILNGKTVRLKDIRSLLSSMGFGLGSLSILSQGQIDSILSLVPTDRRIVLEEVAQIAHFKDNKSRILKKLDSTRDNLTRLDDILKEVESRLEELAEQSEAARKFRELSHVRADLELALSFKETERLVKSIRRNLDELQNKESDLFDLRNEQTDLKIHLTNIERAIDELRIELDDELRKVKEKSLEVEKARSAVELAQKELDACIERRQNGRRSIHRLELETEDLQEQILHEQQNLVQSIDDKTNAHSELNKALERNKELLEDEEKELERINRKETLISKAQNDIDLACGQKSMLEDRLSRAGQYLEEGEEAFADKSSEIKRIENRIAEITKNANTLAEQSTEKDKLRAETQRQLADSARQIETLEKNASNRKDELIRVASELKILNDLENRLAGFNTAVKRLIEAHRAGSLTGIVGPVVDLIKVETGFEKAVEAALGSRSQYVVVETFNDGLNALEHIKKSGGGRATFIPMEDFSGSTHVSQPPEMTKDDGFLGRVIDRITVDNRFKPILENLLGNALIFDNLQSARNSRKKHNLRQWIVTLDGDVHRPDGIFSGGSAESGNDGPLVRRSQISELESRKIQFEKDLGDLNSKLNTSRSSNRDAENTLRQVDRELIELKEDASELSRESHYLLESLTNLERELIELRGRRDKIEKEIKEIESEMSAVESTITSLESQLDVLTDPENNDNELKEKIKNSRSIREAESNRLKIIISSKEQEEMYIKSTISKLEERQKNNVNELNSLRDELLNLVNSEEDTQAEFVKLKYKADRDIEKLTSGESLEQELRQKIDSQRSELSSKRERASEILVRIEETDARRESQSLRVAKMETELVSFLKKVADLENVKAQFPQLLDTDSEDFNKFLESEFVENLPPRKQIVSELDAILKQIEEIGEVNVLAERDFENYQRRREYLVSQRDDMVKAADDMMETLSEIEGESRKAFTEIFEETKQNFETIFKDIFPNGEGRLTLSDPMNILESGLDITVKFPGKKQLDLLQFSGGERSIIAIVFLFAVLKTKPPSFVILDEVEAALDDVNVDNFIQLVKRFSDRFQFVIVTHNKLTMEYSRNLWGVTMKKGGMSQVVSISLDDWIREHPEAVN